MGEEQEEGLQGMRRQFKDAPLSGSGHCPGKEFLELIGGIFRTTMNLSQHPQDFICEEWLALSRWNLENIKPQNNSISIRPL